MINIIMITSSIINGTLATTHLYLGENNRLFVKHKHQNASVGNIEQSQISKFGINSTSKASPAMLIELIQLVQF